MHNKQSIFELKNFFINNESTVILILDSANY